MVSKTKQERFLVSRQTFFCCCQPYDSQTSQEFLEELREDEINVFILFCLEMFL